MFKWDSLTIVLTVSIMFLVIINTTTPIEQNNVKFINGSLVFDSLTLKQKIAQMVITIENPNERDKLNELMIGGIYLGAKPTKEDFKKRINYFQENATIPYFVTTDMEGCINPFENFANFKTFAEIQTTKEAYNSGKDQGYLLSELGFNLDFSPVVDLNDSIWKCRSFPGNEKEIWKKAHAYIKGLESENIISNVKHYPGKTLVGKDPHKFIAYNKITEKDFYPFNQAIKNNVSSIMVSHIIVKGEVDSSGKPSVVSPLVKQLKNKYSGLIISDEIRMSGLLDYYDDIDNLYVDVFKSGNDIVLNFDTNVNELYRMITVVERAVKEGIISEDQIDNSVKKILKAKKVPFI